MFLNCSTCFGQHTAHHQELKNCNCSLWFYLCFWLPAAAMAQPSQRPATKKYVKPEAAITVFELLMMGGVLPGTCWAIKKHWNNKFYYTVASCCFFLRDLSVELVHIRQRTYSSTQCHCFIIIIIYLLFFFFLSSRRVWHLQAGRLSVHDWTVPYTFLQ
jgi:hypothetical protein